MLDEVVAQALFGTRGRTRCCRNDALRPGKMYTEESPMATSTFLFKPKGIYFPATDARLEP